MNQTAKRMRAEQMLPPEKHNPQRPWVRWGQWLGDEGCYYMQRWVLDLRFCTLRVHHFLSGDDPRAAHDHPWWFLTFVLRGSYEDHRFVETRRTESGEYEAWHVETLRAPTIRFRSAAHKHYVHTHGVWTFVISGPPVRQWGFWVKGRFLKASRYFWDYGHPACDD